MHTLTASGREIDVSRPAVADIRISDIAHALSHLCRFGGHCRVHYSVAQHSVFVAKLVKRMTGDSMIALAGLLHDAAEAYLGDVPTPVKRLLPDYELIELRMLSTIAQAYDVDPEAFDHPAVKRADLVALATEKRDLLPAATTRWELLEGIEPDVHELDPWPSAEADLRFQRTFYRLQMEAAKRVAA